MQIHRSAKKHGISDEAINHAIANHAYTAYLDEHETPPRILYLGPDRAGNLLEIVSSEMDDGSELVIHAMKMRRRFGSLIGPGTKS